MDYIRTGKRLFLLPIATLLLVVACNNGTPSSGLPIPPKGFVGDVATGRTLLGQFCSRCHGREARGTERGPPLVHKVYEPSHHSDLTFYMAAAKGVRSHHWSFGHMPPVKDVTPEQVGHIVAFIRSEQRREGIF